MRSRYVIPIVLVTLLGALACAPSGSDAPVPTPTLEPAPTPTATAAPTAIPVPTATSMPTAIPAPTATAVPTPTPTPVSAPQPAPIAIAPCTPIEGADVDPCDGVGFLGATYEAVGGLLADPPDVPFSPGDYLDGFGWADYQIAHIVVRGTYVPGTIHCTSGNRFLVPSHLREGSTLGDSLHIECYANVRVNAYVVGTGPAVLTVTVASHFYGADGQPHPHLDSDDIEELRRNYELALTRGGKYGRSDLAVSGPLGGITGREALLFLGPSANASVEAWEVHTTWDVYKKADGSVVVIHPDAIVYARLIRDDAAWENLQATLLPALSATEQATTEAHNARVAANGGRVRSGQQFPMLVTDADRLSSYFREVGAYDDPDNPPAQPPAATITQCQNGGAVPRPDDNPLLLLDCAALLRAKDDLRGTAPLNWSHTTSITTWNGVTVDRDQDNSLFVRDLALADRGLNGFIPSALADLTGLRRLDLDDNALSGPLPPLLAGLTSLQQLYVSGNSAHRAASAVLGRPAQPAVPLPQRQRSVRHTAFRSGAAWVRSNSWCWTATG